MSTKTVSNLLAPAGYPQWLAALTPQCGDRTASLLCLGLSRFEPSNEQPTSLPAFACLPAALPAAPRRLVCPQPALPFSSLCFFSRCRAAAAPAARRPACAATRQQARSDRDAASAPRSGEGDQAEPFGAYGGTPPQPPPRRTPKSQSAPRGGALRKRPPTPCTAPFATC